MKKEVDKTTEKFLTKIKNQTMEKIEDEKKEKLKDVSPIELFNAIFEQEESESEKDKIIEILFNHKDLRKIADISHNELVDITVLLTFAKDLNVPLINYFCNTRLALSLSKDRKSRQEVVEIYKTQMYSESGLFPPIEQSSRWGRMKQRFSI